MISGVGFMIHSDVKNIKIKNCFGFKKINIINPKSKIYLR